MKRVIAMLIAFVFAASVCGVAFAMEGSWEGKGKMMSKEEMEKKHQEKIDKMTKDLNLTPEQKDKISALMKDKGDKMMAEKKKMMDAEKTIMDDYNAKVKEVLTPEQATKYDKMMEEKKEKMEKKMEKKKEMRKEKSEAAAPK